MHTLSGSTIEARYEALARVSLAMNRPQDIAQIYRVLGEELRGVVGFTFVAVGVYDAKSHTMRMHILEQGKPLLPVLSLMPEETLSFEVFRCQSPLVVPQLDEEVRLPKQLQRIRTHGLKSFCALPLTTAQRRVGAITFGSIYEYPYSDGEVEFLWLIANQVAGAVDNAMNAESSRLARDRLKLLEELNRCASYNPEVSDLLSAISNAVRTGMRCCVSGVLLPDSESGQLRVAASDPAEEGLDAAAFVNSEMSFANKAFAAGKPVLTPSRTNPGSLCLFPLLGRARTLGILFVGRAHEDPFVPDDLEFLSHVGSQVTISLESALARQHVRRTDLLLTEKGSLVPTGSWTWNPKTGECSWSQESFRLLGYDPETVKPTLKLFCNRLHPLDRPLLETVMDRAVREKRGSQAEFRIVLPDGSVRFIRGIGDTIVDQSGTLLELVGTLVDITERRRAEDELRHTAACLAEGQRLTHTGTWSKRALERILGHDPEKVEPSCENFLQSVHPEDRTEVEKAMLRVRGEACDSIHQFRILRGDGATRHVHCRFHPISNAAGDIVEYLATIMDVTEQHLARLALENALGEIRELKDRLHKENVALRNEIRRKSKFDDIVGASPALQQVLSRVEKVAPTDSTVLITGETGTGKELIAQAIHKGSLRAGRAFVSVNCAALPASLIASELFGHERGSFTGALQRRLGRFELADGGTIFLDEIGDLPAETQVTVLRVLQERKFERVGGNHAISVDVRVVVSTNRDLRQAIASGAFRPDLFYRLNVVPIELPPLRDRREDIPILTDYFIHHYARLWGKRIRRVASPTMKLFQTYDWPGNIRELQNVIERSVILCGGETLSADETWICNSTEPAVRTSQSLNEALLEQERRIIEAALAASKGRVSGASGAAVRLGVPQSTLAWRIKAMRIQKDRFKV
ncbi:MAG: sigma 54-interacting transcriptional regulator [Bryobacteraceae bacterium]